MRSRAFVEVGAEKRPRIAVIDLGTVVNGHAKCLATEWR